MGSGGCLCLHKLVEGVKSGPHVFSQVENLSLVHFCERRALNTGKYDAILRGKGVNN